MAEVTCLSLDVECQRRRQRRLFWSARPLLHFSLEQSLISLRMEPVSLSPGLSNNTGMGIH